jgi:16S rRNA (guanine527-N7)-methyltransferase
MNPLWNELAARANVTLSDAQHAALSRYLDLLLEANQTMNLTRITDPAAAAVGHVGDALTLLPYLPAGPFTLADVGSGGGVPGLPLAIARPEAAITLIESTGKKAEFLRRTVEALQLTNVKVQPVRAEDAGHSSMRHTFDVATARAVGVMGWLVGWCLPLVKVGGKMLAMKGPRAAEEMPLALRAIKMLGGGEAVVHPVDLPAATGLVIIEIPKVRRTDHRLPRIASIAKGKLL